VRTVVSGTFGLVSAEDETALALVLTELVTNAVEHGLASRESGTVEVIAEREALALAPPRGRRPHGQEQPGAVDGGHRGQSREVADDRGGRRLPADTGAQPQSPHNPAGRRNTVCLC